METKEQKPLRSKFAYLGDVKAFVGVLSKLDFKLLRLGITGVLLALIEISALLVLASFVNSTLQKSTGGLSSMSLMTWLNFNNLGFEQQAIFCVLIFFTRFLLGLLLQNFILHQTNQLQVSLRSLLFRQSLNFRGGALTGIDKASGAMADVIVRQVTIIGKGIVEPSLRVCGEIVVLVGITALIMIVSPQLMFLMAAVITPVVLFYVFKFKSLSREFGKNANHALEEVSELTTAFCAGWRQLSVPILMDRAVMMLEKRSNHFALNDRLANLVSAAPRYFLELFLALFMIAAVFWVSFSDKLGFAELVFVAGAGLRILPIITSVSNALISFQFNRPILNNVIDIVGPNTNELFRQPINTSGSKNLSKSIPESCSISLKGVTFGYKGQKALFKGLSQELRSGDFFLIQGKSGVGKTTLMDIICGIKSPSEGLVLFNGVQKLPNSMPPLNIFYVPQQPLIIPGTILENIVMLETKSINNEQRAEAICALEMVGLWSLVKSLPGSVDARLGPDGDSLSGGQKQRLVLARALYFGAEVFALDEVVSGLELNSKREILMLLKDLAEKARLIILISHDTVSEEYASKFVSL